MSKLWHLRSSASFARTPTSRQSLELRSHVSFKRRGIISIHDGRKPPQRPESAWEAQDTSDEPSNNFPRQPQSGHHGSTIPPSTSFLPPFQTSPLRKISSESDKMHGKAVMKGGMDKGSVAGALDSPPSLTGLGPWVIAGNIHSRVVASTSGAINSSLQNRTDSSPLPDRIRHRHRPGGPSESLFSFTIEYTTRLHDALGNKCNQDTNMVLEDIKTIFNPHRLNKLKLRGYEPEDVVCWGWILAAETANVAVNRMNIISNHSTGVTANPPSGNIPYFMFATILRSHDLSASSFGLLVSLLSHQLTKQKMSNIYAYPDATTAMLLLVRLVRHARRVAPIRLPAIADLAETLLKVKSVFNPQSYVSLQRLSHRYNRLLSLLSLPANKNPYSSTAMQQQAQFKIIRQMSATEPSVPVNREGYQALAKVQLAHQRTSHEREWARTQSDSWPPWKEDRLGISEDLEYSGSQSRAADVLQRQIQGGYSQTTWDKAAKILAGWDTDKSPTIQTRSIVQRAPLNWFQSLMSASRNDVDGGGLASKDDPEVWAGRIRATRTVREAWGCFCSYNATSKSGEHNQGLPYYAMLEKLAARVHQSDHSSQLPGEGREVFPEPLSSKDHIYLSVEPPSFRSFYEKMRSDGIRPAGRVLSLLLEHARHPREGVYYIETSKLSEVTKDVLLNAQKYDAEVIRSSCKFIQPVVMASFLNFLWRSQEDSSKVWYKPSSQAATDDITSSTVTKRTPMNPRAYAVALMTITRPSVQVFNKVLKTITSQLSTSHSDAKSHYKWQPLRTVFRAMQEAGYSPDMATFHAIGSSIEFLSANDHLFVPTLQFFDDPNGQSRQTHEIDGCLLAKELFLQAVVGNAQRFDHGRFASVDRVAAIRHLKPPPGDNPTWLPLSDNPTILEFPPLVSLHLLMRILARRGEVGSITCLLQWMGRFASEVNEARENLANGRRQLRFALCVAAMAMEDADTNEPAIAKYVETVREVVDQNPDWGGWPTDAELESYLLSGRRSERRENRV